MGTMGRRVLQWFRRAVGNYDCMLHRLSTGEEKVAGNRFRRYNSDVSFCFNKGAQIMNNAGETACQNVLQ